MPKKLFQKGISGNPLGRPKGKTLKEFARELLMTMSDEEKVEYLKTLPKDIVWRMAEGNPAQDVTSAGEKLIPTPIMILRENVISLPHDTEHEGEISETPNISENP